METLSLFLGTSAGEVVGGRHRASSRSVETGPTSEDADDLPSTGAGLLRRLFLRPSVLLAASLTVLALLSAAGCSAPAG